MFRHVIAQSYRTTTSPIFRFTSLYCKNGSVSSKIHIISVMTLILIWYIIRFWMVTASYGVYISQQIMFASVCNHATYISTRYKCFTAKRLQQGYRYKKIEVSVLHLGLGVDIAYYYLPVSSYKNIFLYL